MKSIIPKHKLATRWFHWVNFPILGIMLWSGLLIYWANGIYRIGWGDKTVLKFFPDGFYEALNATFQLANGMAFHFVFMWIFTINGILYTLYTLISGEWRQLVPNRKSFKEAIQVTLYDLHLSKYKPAQDKYNAAQKIAYTSIILMGFGSLITGIAIYKPVQFGWLLQILGGYEWARIEHFTLAIGYTLFFVIHIIQVIKTGWNNFSGMVRGFEVVNTPDVSEGTTNEKES